MQQSYDISVIHYTHMLLYTCFIGYCRIPVASASAIFQSGATENTVFCIMQCILHCVFWL
jgi:hypothetical protein